jgi:hypothetical protein
MPHTTGTVLFAEVLEELDQVPTAHGPVAEATHHDSHTEPETDDDNVALKSPTTPPCLAAVTITPFRFLVKKRLKNESFYQHQDFEKMTYRYYFFGFLYFKANTKI